jgi:4-hydroxy-tetrahydrodipicolinate synthase
MANVRESLSGILPVLVTPFDDSLEIDLHALETEIDWLFASGADGIVFAMVSEMLRLSHNERRILGSEIVRLARGRGPVVLSVGAESTALAVDLAAAAEQSGADFLMANAPIATSATESELLAYYEAILEASDLPLVVQDASGYVGRSLPLDIQSSLYHRHGSDRVMFKPEAPPIGPHISWLRDATGDDVRIFDGSGGIALMDSFPRGLVGTMPGPDLVWAVGALWRALVRGDDSAAYQISESLNSLLTLMGDLSSYIAIGKYLLVAQDILPNARQRGPTSYIMDTFTERGVMTAYRRLRATVETIESAVDPSRRRGVPDHADASSPSVDQVG